jgi:hypothetical protein
MSLKTTIQVFAASALIAASLPALADHTRSDRGHDRWGHRAYEQRHVSREVVQRPIYAPRRVVVERPVYVERPCIRRTTCVRPGLRARDCVSGPDYYPAQVAYPRRYGEANVIGAAAGAAIGAVIGSQVGYGHNRGQRQAVGAAIGGLLGKPVLALVHIAGLRAAAAALLLT